MTFTGEFTFRAFLNGGLDLIQAENVAQLSAAKSALAAETALAGMQVSTGMADLLVEVWCRLLDVVHAWY
jgi:tRNA U34 5-carboxymethylaminomethyl modifying GTPase MnmE/TrmE